MYNSPVPLMIIRPDVHALIEVNGQLVGECAANSHVAMPISDSGDYYICAIPLSIDDGSLRYAVTRKISFESGALAQTLTSDIHVCEWPGGVFELSISAGRLAQDGGEPFPYTISNMLLGDSRELTLYYENGLKLSVTGGNTPPLAFTLGSGMSGRLETALISGREYAAVFTYPGAKERLVLFDENMNSALDICADKIEICDERIIRLESMDTAMKHERRSCLSIDEYGTVSDGPVEIGFFSHEYEYPQTRLALALALCDAVRCGLASEAVSYLAPELSFRLTFDSLKEFLGEFNSARPPISDMSGRLMGLITHDSGSVYSARLFEFEFSDMKITNIFEA